MNSLSLSRTRLVGVGLVEKLSTDKHQAVFGIVKELRNTGAHGASLELDKKEFEQIFADIFDLVTCMFDEEVKYVKKWTPCYLKIKGGDIQDPDIQAMRKGQETRIHGYPSRVRVGRSHI